MSSDNRLSPANPHASYLAAPTLALPEVPIGPGRHSLPGPATHRLLLAVMGIGGAAFVAVLALLAMSLFQDPGARRDTADALPAAVPTSEAATVPTGASEPAGSAEPAAGPSATAAPPAAPADTQPTRPPGRPTDLVAAVRADLSRLVASGQLDRDAAKDLDRRLDDLGRALAAGATDKAWNKLRDVIRRLDDLRDNHKLTAAGYGTLSADLTRLAQAMPTP